MLFFMGCSGAAVTGENRLIFDDQVANRLLIEALNVRHIPYRVDKDGGIWYPAKDVETVDLIAKEIVQVRFSGPALSFVDPMDSESFRKKLTLAKIPYKTKFQHGQEWTTWEKIYDTQVKTIQEKVESESAETAKRARATKPTGVDSKLSPAKEKLLTPALN